MSPRPKSDKSKRHRFELRLDDEMDSMLNECSEKLNTSKTEVINKGIKMVKSELDKKYLLLCGNSIAERIYCLFSLRIKKVEIAY